MESLDSGYTAIPVIVSNSVPLEYIQKASIEAIVTMNSTHGTTVMGMIHPGIHT